MPIISIHDKTKLENYFIQNPFLHIYEIGDLDDFFWPHTIWLGWENKGEIDAVCLIYTPFDPPVVLLLAAPEKQAAMRQLIAAAIPLLPPRIYIHITDGLQNSSRTILFAGILWSAQQDGLA